jgi:gamma-glutamyl-gamma-aminobutyrate hydrolase PuuD
VLGIQCHPEELSRTEKWAARIFAGLVEAAGRYRKAHDRLVSRA